MVDFVQDVHNQVDLLRFDFKQTPTHHNRIRMRFSQEHRAVSNGIVNWLTKLEMVKGYSELGTHYRKTTHTRVENPPACSTSGAPSATKPLRKTDAHWQRMSQACGDNSIPLQHVSGDHPHVVHDPSRSSAPDPEQPSLQTYLRGVQKVDGMRIDNAVLFFS